MSDIVPEDIKELKRVIRKYSGVNHDYLSLSQNRILYRAMYNQMLANVNKIEAVRDAIHA